MEKQELRIGNYIDTWRINDEWKPKQIKSGHEIDFILAQQAQDIYRFVKLTREWVERFEYKFKEKGHPDMAVSTSFRIDDDTPVDVHFVTGNFHKKIEYVHQLQNLYFDYVGEELKEKELCHEH